MPDQAANQPTPNTFQQTNNFTRQLTKQGTWQAKYDRPNTSTQRKGETLTSQSNQQTNNLAKPATRRS